MWNVYLLDICMENHSDQQQQQTKTTPNKNIEWKGSTVWSLKR